MLISSGGLPQKSPKRKVDHGLFTGNFDHSDEAPIKDSKIIIVKINRKYAYHCRAGVEFGSRRAGEVVLDGDDYLLWILFSGSRSVYRPKDMDEAIRKNIEYWLR